MSHFKNICCYTVKIINQGAVGGSSGDPVVKWLRFSVSSRVDVGLILVVELISTVHSVMTKMLEKKKKKLWMLDELPALL